MNLSKTSRRHPSVILIGDGGIGALSSMAIAEALSHPVPVLILPALSYEPFVVEKIPPYLADNQVMVSSVSHETAKDMIERHLLAVGVIRAGEDNTAKIERIFNQLKNMAEPKEPAGPEKMLLELKALKSNPINEKEVYNPTGRIPWNPRKSKKRR